MMIAGFVRPDSGTIIVSGKSILAVRPHQRNIGLVFQNYALFPHMTVSENLAYPLKLRKVNRVEIRRRVGEMLELVALQDKAGFKPDALSGGQQQRVALARALVFDPAVVLLDEPLSALDRKLRDQLQLEIKRIQQRMNATVILVTHDQQEALTMSDRIAVMSSGAIVQCERPALVYERPATRFVAEFLGESNVLSGRVRAQSQGTISVHDESFGPFWMDDASDVGVGQTISVIVRPERIRLSANRIQDAPNQYRCKVRELIYVGDSMRVQLECGRRLFVVKLPSIDSEMISLTPGSEAYLRWSTSDVVVVRNDDGADMTEST